MASSKFELLRSACEAIENSEKVLAIAYQNRKKFLNKLETTANAADAQQAKEAEKEKSEDGEKGAAEGEKK